LDHRLEGLHLALCPDLDQGDVEPEGATEDGTGMGTGICPSTTWFRPSQVAIGSLSNTVFVTSSHLSRKEVRSSPRRIVAAEANPVIKATHPNTKA
jgi:hypothetical protein